MNTQDVILDLCLTKQQAKRLRYYFSLADRAVQHTFDVIDLDLIGFKLIETQPCKYSGNKITLTPLGTEVLHRHRQATITARSVHHDLGGRLAEYLRKQGRITWENIEFRNWLMEKTHPISKVTIDYAHWQCVRPDVFSILPSLQMKNANPCVHEVKISRADFLSDLSKPEKRDAYAAMAEAVYYVAPEGMISPAEIPPGLGLLVERKEGVFVLSKRPKKRKVELQSHHYLNMIIKPGAFPDNYGF